VVTTSEMIIGRTKTKRAGSGRATTRSARVPRVATNIPTKVRRILG